MQFMNKVTVITPESFSEFYSEHPNAVRITEDRMLIVTEVIENAQVRVKIFAAGEWLTVETELIEVVEEDFEDEEEFDGFGL